MEWVTTLGIAMGASWVSGVRLYGSVATLGWLHRAGYAQLPGNLDILATDWVVWVATAMFVVEFLADKVPWFDTVWDAIHTFIRIPAGAVLASAAFAQFDPKVQVVAFLLGGAITATSHASKSSIRVIANASPEPVSNWTLSLSEDFVAAAQTGLIVLLPLVALGAVAVMVGLSIWLLPKLGKRACDIAKGSNSVA